MSIRKIFLYTKIACCLIIDLVVHIESRGHGKYEYKLGVQILSDHNNTRTAEFSCLRVDTIDGRTEVGKLT